MAVSRWPDSRLGGCLHGLERQHRGLAEPRFAGPLEMILREIVGYLADDARRGAAFDALREKVGSSPKKIAAAPEELLCEIARIGGSIAAEERAERLRAAALLTLDEFGGDLNVVLKLPAATAKKQIMRFPTIGEPGRGEEMLMFSGVLPVLALESNGLRVLVRLGFGEDRKSYAATYRSVREVTLEELRVNCKLLTKAHLLLRAHGRQVCLRNGPVCQECAVSADCFYFQNVQGQAGS